MLSCHEMKGRGGKLPGLLLLKRGLKVKKRRQQFERDNREAAARILATRPDDSSLMSQWARRVAGAVLIEPQLEQQKRKAGIAACPCERCANSGLIGDGLLAPAFLCTCANAKDQDGEVRKLAHLRQALRRRFGLDDHSGSSPMLVRSSLTASQGNQRPRRRNNRKPSRSAGAVSIPIS